MKAKKYIFKSKLLLVFIAIILVGSCTKDKIGDKTRHISAPGKAILTIPENNKEIEVGEIIDEKAEVTFAWNESSATEKYDLTIINLTTRDTILNIGLINNTTDVWLFRGFTYSWMISSRNSGDIKTDSEVWKFYLTGDTESNNLPSPPTLLSPISGATVVPIEGKVTLEWEGVSKDADGEEVTFFVFIDKIDGNQETPDEWKNLTEKAIEVSVEPETIYYWHVEASDGKNYTTSPTFTFETGDKNSSTIEGTIVSTTEEILAAIASASPGEKIYVHGGSYAFDTTIAINISGSTDNLIALLAYPEDESRPIFDFSTMSENSANRGIQLNASYWHLKGIDVYGAGDNGMFVRGNNNLIEFCTFSENSDTGLQLGNGASNNTILNCDSFFNADATLENADGFACKLDAGTGNKFIGCRAWQNLDDGWDGYLRGSDDITTTYENCWAFKNGILKNGSVGAGDGNGFKTGGSDDKLLKHNASYTNCIAVGNINDGFDHNSNRGNITIYNCSVYDNGKNLNFSTANSANALVIKNSISFAGKGNDGFSATTVDITNNSWQNGLSVNATDFISLDINVLSSPRKADGSLPDIDFMQLSVGSDLIDAGINIGLQFKGAAPDLGAFEK